MTDLEECCWILAMSLGSGKAETVNRTDVTTLQKRNAESGMYVVYLQKRKADFLESLFENGDDWGSFFCYSHRLILNDVSCGAKEEG